MKSRYFSYLCAAMFIILCATVIVTKCCSGDNKKNQEKIEAKTNEDNFVLDIPRIGINSFGTATVSIRNTKSDMPGNMYYLSIESAGSKGSKKEEVRAILAMKKDELKSVTLGKSEIAPDPFQIELTAYQLMKRVYSGSYKIASEKMVEVSDKNSIDLKVNSHWLIKDDGNFQFNICNIGTKAIPQEDVYYIKIRSVTDKGDKVDEIRRLTLNKNEGKQHQLIKLGKSEVASKGNLIELIFEVYAVEKRFSEVIDIKDKITKE